MRDEKVVISLIRPGQKEPVGKIVLPVKAQRPKERPRPRIISGPTVEGVLRRHGD